MGLKRFLTLAVGSFKTEPFDFVAPVGSTIFWHKTMTNTPELPASWVECNGQTLNDEDSVYHGQVIPDINGEDRFIRGSATSGTKQAATEHNMFYMFATGNIAVYANATDYGLPLNRDRNTGSGANPSPIHDKHRDAGSNTNSRYTSRPINISMVAIMRIK